MLKLERADDSINIKPTTITIKKSWFSRFRSAVKSTFSWLFKGISRLFFKSKTNKSVKVEKQSDRDYLDNCTSTRPPKVNLEGLERYLPTPSRSPREMLTNPNPFASHWEGSNHNRPAWGLIKPADVKKRIEALEKSSGFQG